LFIAWVLSCGDGIFEAPDVHPLNLAGSDKIQPVSERQNRFNAPKSQHEAMGNYLARHSVYFEYKYETAVAAGEAIG
jgi:hypothetical protein